MELTAVSTTSAAGLPCVERKIPTEKSERREEIGNLILRMRGAVVGDEEALAPYPKIAGFSRRRAPPLSALKEETLKEE